MTCNGDKLGNSSAMISAPVGKSVSEQLSEKISYENTYKMKPDGNLKLRGFQDMVRQILSETISDLHYDAVACSSVATNLATKINEQIKSQTSHRFKLVTFVAVGQVNGAGVNVGSRCLWDTRFDHFLEEIYQNASVYVVATVYMMYRE